MKIEKKAKGKGKAKGKAIIGIAMAAIMLASVFVAMVPTATAVAPGVTVDKVTCGTTVGVDATYTFTITNNDAFADTFMVTYPALLAEWISTPWSGYVIAPIAAGGTGTFTLMLTPWAAYAPPINVPVTVTSGWSGDATTKTIGCYMTPLTYNGLRNVIPAPPGAYDPSNPADPNYIPPTAAIIGQDLDLSALIGVGAVVPATIKGDPTNPATAGEIFTTDAAGMFDAAVMTVPGIYYINPTGGSSTTAPTSCWGVLAVADPTMNLDLRVSGTSVSSITQGTPLQIRFVKNLNANDMVTLKIIDPDGDQIMSTPDPVQQFSKINVMLIHEVYGVVGIDTTDWMIGTYTFQVKTDEDVVAGNGARGLDAASNEKTLTITKGIITINADQTTVPELKTVRLTVTGVTGHVIRIDSSCWGGTLFPGGLEDNPAADTTATFVDTIDADGKRTYAVEFLDTGAYTITVTDTTTGWTDTVDITVEEKAVTFDMPAIVTLGEKLTIKGTANTGDWVAIAFDDVIPAGYDRLTIYGNGEISKDIATGPTSPSSALKAPGSTHIKAFINLDLSGMTFPVDVTTIVPEPTDDGSTKVFLLNDAGGGIDISASGINVAKNETIILTIEALPGHNVSVTTADPAHTVFEYNRYDFTGTSNNIINIAPADTISIPADIGDCGSQADAMNIYGVWKTMNADGIRKFEVLFTDIGTYKITATDYA
jgi:hypothetical protein